MQENTLQTLIDAIKDLTGLTNVSTTKVVRAINFTADEYSRIQVIEGGNRDFSAYNNISRETATITGEKASLDSDVVAIEHVDLLVDGKYRKLEPVESREFETPLDTLYNTPGTPQYYEYRNHHLYFYPAASGSFTARLTYMRAHPRFSADNLNAATSITPIDDEFLVFGAARRLMIGSNDPSVADVRDTYEQMKADVRTAIAKFDQDKSKRLKPKQNAAFISSFKRNRR